MDLNESEKKIFDSLSTPSKIQDFLNSLSMREDENEPIVRSPRYAIEKGEASCMEGALIALAALIYHKNKGFLLDLRVGPRTRDVDHVVCLFEKNGLLGALSKTSHSVLRYREPIHKDTREVAISYFHEYFTDDGKKNLRQFSDTFDVEKKYGLSWITSEEDLAYIAATLDDSPHEDLVPGNIARTLRDADPVEIEAGKLKEDDV